MSNNITFTSLCDVMCFLTTDEGVLFCPSSGEVTICNGLETEGIEPIHVGDLMWIPGVHGPNVAQFEFNESNLSNQHVQAWLKCAGSKLIELFQMFPIK